MGLAWLLKASKHKSEAGQKAKALHEKLVPMGPRRWGHSPRHQPLMPFKIPKGPAYTCDACRQPQAAGTTCHSCHNHVPIRALEVALDSVPSNLKEDFDLCATCFDNEVRSLTADAKEGDADAQFALGTLYAEEAISGEQLAAKSAKWLARAAEQDLIDAQVKLAAAFAEGRGVKKNLTKAGQWLRKAAKLGQGLGTDSAGVARRGEFRVSVDLLVERVEELAPVVAKLKLPEKPPPVPQPAAPPPSAGEDTPPSPAPSAPAAGAAPPGAGAGGAGVGAGGEAKAGNRKQSNSPPRTGLAAAALGVSAAPSKPSSTAQQSYRFGAEKGDHAVYTHSDGKREIVKVRGGGGGGGGGSAAMDGVSGGRG